jgi:hypothetical protein
MEADEIDEMLAALGPGLMPLNNRGRKKYVAIID